MWNRFDVNSKHIYTVLIPFSIIAFGFLLRIYKLGDESLWIDEGATYNYMQNDYGYLITELSFNDPHTPLYYIVVKLWTSVFGTSELSLRFPSVIFGTVALLVIYLFAKKIFNYRVAIVALSLSSFNYYQLYYAQEARMYTMLILFGVLSMYYTVLFLRSFNTRNLLYYIISTSILGYTHAHGVFIIMVENIFVLYILYRYKLKDRNEISARNKLDLVKKWVFSQLAVFVVLIPWLLILVLRASEGSSPSWLSVPMFDELILTYSRYMGYGFRSGAIVISALLLPLLLMSIFTKLEDTLKIQYDKEHSFSLIFLSLLLVVPTVMPFIISHTVTPIYFPRYSMLVSIALIILISKGFVTLLQTRPIPIPVIFGFILVVSILLLGPVSLYYGEQTRSEWDSLVDTVEDNASSNDAVIIDSEYFGLTYDYYSEKDNYDVYYLNDHHSSDLDGTVNPESIEKYIANVTGTIYYISRNGVVSIDDEINDTHTQVSKKSYLSPTLYTYEPKEQSE